MANDPKQDFVNRINSNIATALDRFAVPVCYGKQPSRETSNDLMWKVNNDRNDWVAAMLDGWVAQRYAKEVPTNHSYNTITWTDEGHRLLAAGDASPREFAESMYWQDEAVIKPVLEAATAHGNQLAQCAKCKYHENCWRQSLLDHNRIVER